MSYTYEYPRPCVTVDMVVFRRNGDALEVLLIQRKYPPHQDMWAFPGGFINIDETLEDAAKRELKEETGLSGIKLKQLHTFGDVHRDPRARVITVVYYGMSDFEKSVAKADDDAKAACWYAVGKVPEMAFDHHKVLLMALDKL